MTTYAVFAKGTDSILFTSERAMGYLEAMEDEEIVRDIREGNVWLGSPVEKLFPGDRRIKAVLGEMGLPQRYDVMRAEILDSRRLEEAGPQMKERYGLEYRLYEAEMVAQARVEAE